MTGVKGGFDGGILHDFGGGAESDLLPVEDQGIGENLGDVFQLVMGGDDEVTTAGKFDQRIGKVAAAFDVEPIEWFV